MTILIPTLIRGDGGYVIQLKGPNYFGRDCRLYSGMILVFPSIGNRLLFSLQV